MGGDVRHHGTCGGIHHNGCGVRMLHNVLRFSLAKGTVDRYQNGTNLHQAKPGIEKFRAVGHHHAHAVASADAQTEEATGGPIHRGVKIGIGYDLVLKDHERFVGVLPDTTLQELSECIRACSMPASMSRMPVDHVAAARYHSPCPSTSPAGGNAAVRCYLEFGIIPPGCSRIGWKAERTEAHHMAKDGFKVMDSDMHIVEPVDLWERYMDPAFKDRAPRGLRRHPRDLGRVVN
jgi:hypothetical protein